MKCFIQGVNRQRPVMHISLPQWQLPLLLKALVSNSYEALEHVSLWMLCQSVILVAPGCCLAPWYAEMTHIWWPSHGQFMGALSQQLGALWPSWANPFGSGGSLTESLLCSQELMEFIKAESNWAGCFLPSSACKDQGRRICSCSAQFVCWHVMLNAPAPLDTQNNCLCCSVSALFGVVCVKDICTVIARARTGHSDLGHDGLLLLVRDERDVC